MIESSASLAGDLHRRIGLIGLGAMGSPVATRLLRAGHGVIGFDVAPDRVAELERAGGTPAGSVAEIARMASMVITLLPSSTALGEVCDEIATAMAPARSRAGLVVVDLSTLGLQPKLAARDALARAGVAMLDGALSGTAIQAAAGDVVVYLSGVRAIIERCEPVLRAMSRRVHRLGDFGQATRTKLVANHLVAIHIAAAAEALLLARRSGLDPDAALAALTDGAGTSRMLEVRGPIMVSRAFEPASMRLALFLKDVDLIESLGREMASPTPLFDVTAELFRSAVASGHGDQDTSAVFTRLEGVVPQ